MSRHGWYFTIIGHGETAIEYAVFCVDDEFDRTVQTLRDTWKGLEGNLGPNSRPTLEVAYPPIALVKTLVGASEEAVDESIDSTDGFWAKLPLQPMQELLHQTGELSTVDVLGLLRETAVHGSHARLFMQDPDHICFNINPGDHSEIIETSYINPRLLPSHTNKH